MWLVDNQCFQLRFEEMSNDTNETCYQWWTLMYKGQPFPWLILTENELVEKWDVMVENVYLWNWKHNFLWDVVCRSSKCSNNCLL